MIQMFVKKNILCWNVFIVLALMILMPMDLPAEKKKSGDMNVLLITVDTLRWNYVSIYGSSPVNTPAFDNLGQKSVVFRFAYSHNPVTLPAHVNIMTGRLPLAHGISDNAIFTLPASETTLAEFLKSNGYRTAAFIAAFPLHSRYGLNQGFDVYDDELPSRMKNDLYFVEKPAAQVLKQAGLWIKAQKQKWFVWIHLFDPHFPYQPPAPFRESYASNLYAGEVAYVDSELGKFLTQLSQRKLLDKTVVVFTADHGEALGEKGEKTHSYFAYNCTIRVPLFIQIPGMKAKTVDENVSHVDIFPTLCDLLNLKPIKGLQGESLLPIMAGGKRVEKSIYFESLTPYYSSSWAPLRGYINGREKFMDLPIPELYNLEVDPREDKNQIEGNDASDYKKTLSRLMKKYGHGEIQPSYSTLDPEVQRKLRSLGYISASGAKSKQVQFTEKDDLKTMLPIHVLLEKGLASYQQGNSEEAKGVFQQVIEAAPYYVMAYIQLAAIFEERGNGNMAVSVLKKGLSKTPDNLLIQSVLGRTYAETGRPDEAVSLLKKCIIKDPKNPELYNYLGLALYYLGQWDEARKNYEKAIELDASTAAVFNNLGNLFFKLFTQERSESNITQAIAHFRRAIELAPSMANPHNGLAMALYYQGQKDEALTEMAKAEKLFPENGEILYNYGIVLLETDKPAEALMRFQKYHRLFAAHLNENDKKKLEALINETQSKL